MTGIEVLMVAIGGFAGGVARVAASSLAAHVLGDRFPWGTFVVNVTGALAIGVMAAAFDPYGTAWHFWIIGVLGSYTTVSTFALQSLYLIEVGQYMKAGVNIGGSLVACILAAAAGMAMVG